MEVNCFHYHKVIAEKKTVSYLIGLLKDQLGKHTFEMLTKKYDALVSLGVVVAKH